MVYFFKLKKFFYFIIIESRKSRRRLYIDVLEAPGPFHVVSPVYIFSLF